MAYYSLHEKTKRYWYYNLADEYVYVDLSGFQDRNNLNDSRLLCGYESGCDPPPETKSRSVTLSEEQIWHFRVYIPPGTTYLYLRVDKTNHGQIAAVARVGQEPSGSYGGYSYSDFETADNCPSDGTTLSHLRSEDCIQTDSGGILYIIDRYETVGSYDNIDEGWLYVDLYQFTGVILQHDYVFTVNVNNYLDWYDTVEWGSNGNPVNFSGGFIPQIIMF